MPPLVLVMKSAVAAPLDFGDAPVMKNVSRCHFYVRENKWKMNNLDWFGCGKDGGEAVETLNPVMQVKGTESA